MQFPATLVLGATGRVGQVLHRCWAGQDMPVLWQSRRALSGSGDWVVFDPLRDMGAFVAAARGRAAILCLAGAVPGRNDRLEDNTALAEAAIRAAAATGARVLLTSSAAVYGNRSGALSERLPPRPENAYGLAKAEMEARGAALGAELGVRVSALRIGNIAGLDAILGNWRPGFQLDVFADGRTPQRSYIGPETLARVLYALCATPDLPPVLNVAAQGAVEMGALLDAAGLGWTPRPAPPGAIADVHLSVEALQALVPLEPECGSPEALVAEWRPPLTF